MLYVQSYVVFYKADDAGLSIPLTLPLSVSLCGFGVRLPVGLLIIGVLRSPLLPAVLDHPSIQGISPRVAARRVSTTLRQVLTKFSEFPYSLFSTKKFRARIA